MEPKGFMSPPPKQKPIVNLMRGSGQDLFGTPENLSEKGINIQAPNPNKTFSSPFKETLSDRFIPFRSGTKVAKNLFDLPPEFSTPQPTRKNEPMTPEEQNHLKYNSLLTAGLLELASENQMVGDENDPLGGAPKSYKLLTYHRFEPTTNAMSALEELPPTGQLPKTLARPINKVPFKVLDAPDLKDDFYLNLMDWSKTNFLTVALGNSIYLWSGDTGKVERLGHHGGPRHGRYPVPEGSECTALKWDSSGKTIATGRSSGVLEIWDMERCQLLLSEPRHRARVGCIAWNNFHPHILATGSRDNTVKIWDIRTSERRVQELVDHKLEVCGLSFAPHDATRLASGGNDNKVYVWNMTKPNEPELRLGDHSAAVKALAWSPHQSGVLATGSGTRDTGLRLWNTINGALISEVKTNSQICSIAFSHTVNEIATAHGYSQNDVVIWKAPNLQKMAVFDCFEARVLYLAVSPNGQYLASGAADQTIKLWDVFPVKEPIAPSILSASNLVLR